MKSVTTIAIVLTALCFTAVAARKNWVLLIAGSNGYYNYRHQADVCHAYQIFHKAGIPDEQIVVMMYDDIANNEANPYKGNIINKPNGPNVYPGVPKDYTKKNVNADVFLAVLQGNKTGVKMLTGREGKVIDSGPDDYIFVNFADHGGPGILATPSGPDIKASALNKAIKDMHANKRYAKMIFYVEACYSGSMFYQLLPANINVYATTAANPDESSYACYLDKTRGTYLGDVYSVKWMEDTDVANLHTETFHEQFEKVKKETNTSHVMQYGDTSMDSLALEKFIGEDKQRVPEIMGDRDVPLDRMHPERVREETIKMKLSSYPVGSEKWQETKQEWFEYKRLRAGTDRLFYTIAKNVHGNLREDTLKRRVLNAYEDINSRDCYEAMVDHLVARCPGLEAQNNYAALRQFQVLVNLCNHHAQQTVHDAILVATGMNPVCPRR